MSLKYRVPINTNETGTVTAFCCEEMERAYLRRDVVVDAYTGLVALNFRPRLMRFNYCPFCKEEVGLERESC